MPNHPDGYGQHRHVRDGIEGTREEEQHIELQTFPGALWVPNLAPRTALKDRNKEENSVKYAIDPDENLDDPVEFIFFDL